MFTNSFKTQFYTMIQQIGFKICFLSVLLISFTNSAILLIPFYKKYSGYLVDISYTSLLNFYSPLVDLFHIISLFLLLLPYSFPHIKREHHYENTIHTNKPTFKIYYLAGSLVSFLGTFCAFFIPLFINLIINQLFFDSTGILGSGFSMFEYNGAADIVGLNITESVSNPGYCIIPIKIFVNHSQLYNLFYTFLYSIFMGILAVHMYTISFYFQKKIYIIIYIYLLYYITNTKYYLFIFW